MNQRQVIPAEATIIRPNGEVVEIKKEFSSYKAAEEWVANMIENERCFYAGCSTLAFLRLT